MADYAGVLNTNDDLPLYFTPANDLPGGFYGPGYVAEFMPAGNNGELSLVGETPPFSAGEGSHSLISELQVQPAVSAATPSGGAVTGWSMQRNFLYDTIHITPVKFSLGAVTNDQAVSSLVWNAFFSVASVTGVTSVNSSGIADSFSPLVAFDIAPLEEVSWGFSIYSASGPAVIDSSFTATINGADYTVKITGVRSLSFGYFHNWESPLVETLAWLSSVQVTHDGGEHRAALRRKARRTFDEKLYLPHRDVRDLEAKLFGWQDRSFVIPIPNSYGKLSAAAEIGDTRIYLDTTAVGFKVSGVLSINGGIGSGIEIQSISGITPAYIDLASPLTRRWGVNSFVHPAEPATIVGNVPLVWATNEFATASIRFELVPGYADPFTPDLPIEDTYRGEEVLLTEPDWSSSLPRDFTYENSVLDSVTGVKAVAKTWSRPARSTEFSWLLRNRLETESFRGFLNRRRGRVVAFWMPSFISEYKSVPADYPSGSSAIQVFDNSTYAMTFDGSGEPKNERRDVVIELRNGSRFFRRIVSGTTPVGGQFSLQLDSSIPVAFSSADILRLSVLGKYRLNSDEVSFEWINPVVARVTIPLVTVPDITV